jgi:hypothetical protein
MLGCNCGVCVGIEYFNYACRRLPFLIFFAPYFCGKPCLTVQKMWNHPNLGHRGGILPHSDPQYKHDVVRALSVLVGYHLS